MEEKAALPLPLQVETDVMVRMGTETTETKATSKRSARMGSSCEVDAWEGSVTRFA
jgi:hypothetical protein